MSTATASRKTSKQTTTQPAPLDIETQTERLADLAKDICVGLDQVSEATVTTLEQKRNLGQSLIQAKDLTRTLKTPWLPWLRDNCRKMTERQAQRYMLIAKEWEHLTIRHVSDPDEVSLRGALAEITRVNKARKIATSPAAIAKRQAENEKFQKEMAERVAKQARQPLIDAAAQEQREVGRTVAQLRDDYLNGVALSEGAERKVLALQAAEREAERTSPERVRQLTYAQDVITAGYKIMAIPDGGSKKECDEIRDRLQALVEQAWGD